MNSLGERIKFLREKMKMTQQELGDVVKLHGSNIGRIEKGKVFPDSDVLLKMAIYFGVPCDWLLTGEDISSPSSISPEEQQLLTYYCVANEEGKDRIMEQAELLSGKYSLESKNNKEKNS